MDGWRLTTQRGISGIALIGAAGLLPVKDAPSPFPDPICRVSGDYGYGINLDQQVGQSECLHSEQGACRRILIKAEYSVAGVSDYR